MYKYFISLCFVLISLQLQAQENKTVENDTIVYKTNYGLRLGIDISKPIRGALQDFYSGFEIVADYRIKKNLYLAAEIGTEEQTFNEDFTNATGKGSYMRLGVNFNTYKNWLDMNNEIYVGFRYGLSLFEQTLNHYTINVGNGGIPAQQTNSSVTYDGLSAHWGELVLGYKAEVYNNLFLAISGSYKIMVSVKDPDNHKSLFAPGFNRIYASNTGFGFNYTISYLIPFKKK